MTQRSLSGAGTFADARHAIGPRRQCSTLSTPADSSADTAAEKRELGREQKIVAEVAREAAQAYKQSVGEFVLPKAKKDWLSHRLAVKSSPLPKEKKHRPDMQHLPEYKKAGLKTILASNAAELEAAVNDHFIPALLPFCPPEVRGKENVTPEDVLKVFDEATAPLMTDPDGNGKYRACVCGLDTEGRYIVLIQLSIGECAILFRSWALCKFPDNVARLLKSPGLVKLGVGVVEDGLAIQKEHKREVHGCVDLRNIAHVVSVFCRTPVHGFSLRLLAAQFAGVRLSKTYQVSDWARQVLSEGQINYAAHDATIAEDIYLTMKESLDAVDLTRDHMLRLLQQFSDSRQQMSFSSVTNMSEPVSLDTVVESAVASLSRDSSASRSSAAPAKLPETGDGRRKLDDKVDALCASAKKPVARSRYVNCKLLNKDGSFLAFIDHDRLTWYLQRDLAVLVAGKATSADAEIQLTFQVAAEKTTTRETERRLNVCVVCGTDNFQCLHGVIPMIYRRHFPERLKSHFSHDKVLLCHSCSAQYSFASHRLCDYFDIVHGLSVGATRSQVNDAVVSAKTARAAGRALLLHNKGQFTEERVKGLKQTIADFFSLSLDDVDDKVLQQAMDIDLADSANSVTENGRLIVEKLQAAGEYECEKFLIQWRQYFLDMMQPKHLPSFWSVTYMLDERIQVDDKQKPAPSSDSESATDSAQSAKEA